MIGLDIYYNFYNCSSCHTSDDGYGLAAIEIDIVIYCSHVATVGLLLQAFLMFLFSHIDLSISFTNIVSVTVSQGISHNAWFSKLIYVFALAVMLLILLWAANVQT